MDARIRYTRMRIREAIFQLLSMKSVRDISIKEVCELAEINRATFYKHYMDIYDLIDKLEIELMNSIFSEVQALPGVEQSPEDTELPDVKETGMVRYLNSIAINQGVIHVLGGPNGDELFCKKIAGQLLQADSANIQMSITEGKDSNAVLMENIVKAATGEIIFHWIQNGTEENAELIAKRIKDIRELLMGRFAPEQAIEPETIWVPLQPLNSENEPVQAVEKTENNFMGWLKRTLFVE